MNFKNFIIDSIDGILIMVVVILVLFLILILLPSPYDSFCQENGFDRGELLGNNTYVTCFKDYKETLCTDDNKLCLNKEKSTTKEFQLKKVIK